MHGPLTIITIYLSTYLSIHVPIYPPIYLPIYLPTYLLPIYLSIHLHISLSTYLPGGHAVAQLVEALRYKSIPDGVIGIFH